MSPALAVDAVVPIAKLEVPAPINPLTSAALIFVLRVGTEPSLNIAGVPVSLTLLLLAVMSLACVLDMVVVSPAIAVEAVVPIAKSELPVPAPIKALISPAVIPEVKDGSVPSDSIAGLPVSVTLAVLFVIAVACADVIPVLALLVVMFDA